MSFIQPSKSVSILRTRAPFAIGYTSWAMLILLAGKNTMLGIPAAAQYAANAALVSPVLAHPTALIFLGSYFLIVLTWLTNTVIPKSLKDPV